MSNPSMTSRPAAPESETPEPETDVLLKARPALWEDWNSADLHALEMHARSLERRLAAALLDVEGHKAGEGCQHKRAEEAATTLSLAQTEIKGHMRIEDELKQQVLNAKEICDALSERHKRDEARIAELEKLVEEAREEFRHHSPEMDSWLVRADAVLRDRA